MVLLCVCVCVKETEREPDRCGKAFYRSVQRSSSSSLVRTPTINSTFSNLKKLSFNKRRRMDAAGWRPRRRKQKAKKRQRTHTAQRPFVAHAGGLTKERNDFAEPPASCLPAVMSCELLM